MTGFFQSEGSSQQVAIKDAPVRIQCHASFHIDEELGGAVFVPGRDVDFKETLYTIDDYVLPFPVFGDEERGVFVPASFIIELQSPAQIQVQVPLMYDTENNEVLTNDTWLPLGGDSFERNGIRFYSVLSGHAIRVSDITDIRTV